MADGSGTESGLPSKEEKTGSGKPRVLVIEDDEPVLKLLGRCIELHGVFDETLTRNIPEALERLEEARKKGQRYDLIISDLGLGDKPEGGLEIAKRTREKNSAGYFILFTGRAGRFKEMTEKQLGELGINVVVGKPFSNEALEGCLDAAKEAILKSPQVSR